MERYWGNSVPGVQAVVERDGPSAGRWDIPGGFLDEGEDAIAGLQREVYEETGLEVETIGFLRAWNEEYWDRTVLCLTWVVRATGGEQQPGDDLVELRWFDTKERPRGAELAFPTFDSILDLWTLQRTSCS